jgi:hypothetical protein
VSPSVSLGGGEEQMLAGCLACGAAIGEHCRDLKSPGKAAMFSHASRRWSAFAVKWRAIGDEEQARRCEAIAEKKSRRPVTRPKMVRL